MKQLCYTIILNCILLLSACSQDEVLHPQGFGYLAISEICFTSEGENLPLTKTVDEALLLEIWQNDEVLSGHTYEAGSVPERIALAPGTYILKALSADYPQEAINEEKGIPAYYIEYPFTIVTGDNIAIELTVPMRNIGILFAPSVEFKREFPTFSIKVESSSRSYTFNETNYSDACYFNTPTSGSLSYTITATNTDNEAVGPLQKSVKVTEGTVYTLTLDIE